MALTRPNQTQLVTTVAKFNDALIPLNAAETGENSKDIGFVFERGSLTNVALIWDESADQFVAINTDEVGTTSGNVSITSYADLRVGVLTASEIDGGTY